VAVSKTEAIGVAVQAFWFDQIVDTQQYLLVYRRVLYALGFMQNRKAWRTFNVEANLPTLDEARRLIIVEIKSAKSQGIKVLKIIQGYGSSGKGGALCMGLRKSFGLRKKEGVIKDFIPGEDFSIFNNTTLSILEAVPELRGDPDLNAANERVTILWLK
jgi:hypothetical protein